MSELFPHPPTPSWGDSERTEHVDLTRDVRESRYRWMLQSARWRARELAETIFGRAVPSRLEGVRGSGARALAFHGLLRLRVPFGGLEQHRRRERLFTASAAEDPVLSRVPLVYLFDPVPDGTEDGSHR